MSINLVWRTDVHMADRGPASRTDDWAEAVLDKLGQVRDIAREVGAAAILDGGDFFHVKSPGRNSHALIQRVAEHHANYPCPVYCTPGNHDSVYGDYAFLHQQPLGVLYSAGVFRRLYDEHEALFEEGEFVGLGGDQMVGGSTGFKNRFSVRVVGIPYHGSRYDMDRFHSIKRGSEDVLICVAHLLASKDGGSMFEGEDIVRYSDLLDTAPDVFCFGHWHKDQGVEELGGKQFVNLGSLTRGSLSQDEVQRIPASAIIRCSPEGVDIEVRRLRVRPAEEVFDVEGRARQIKREVDMEAFVSSIREALQPLKEGESLAEAVTSMQDVAHEIRERALSYLEQT
jgi:DNA repair protein SbcD/Mre11